MTTFIPRTRAEELNETNATSHFKHIPALDGLRGVAILLVFIFHCRIPGLLKAGYIGVDIFLVLSGFLITALLLKEYEQCGQISLKFFYMRRALRLLPALFTMLATLMLVSVIFFDAQRVIYNLIDSSLAIFYVANWRKNFGIYHPNWLAHTWSLALEEQFYIIWPLVAISVLKTRLSMHYLATKIIIAAAGWWIYRLAISATSLPYHRIYHGIDTRADSLLIGCAIAAFIFTDQWQELRKQKNLLLFLGLIAIVFLSWVANYGGVQQNFMVTWGFLLVAVSTVILLLNILSGPQNLFSRVFSLRWLVFLGQISYGFYLWHYPIVRILRLQHFSSWEIFCLSGSIGLGLTVLSYYLIEKPCLKLKHKFSYSRPA